MGSHTHQLEGRGSKSRPGSKPESDSVISGFAVASRNMVGTLKANSEQIKRVLGRCLRLRCPACGESRIVTRPFHIRHHCPDCLALFKREDGFFVGAILANVVTTEIVILAVCFFFLLIVGADYANVLVLLFILAL